jgi:hypothetical protein
MTIATLPPPPKQTANPAPPRPTHSVRRTSSVDVSWPDGETGGRLFVGRARDYLTPAEGGPGRVLGEGAFRARIDDDKTIMAISAEPPISGIEQIVGARAGNHLRLALRETLPDLIAAGAPLYLPLDDLSGTALVSSFAWSHWHGSDMIEQMRAKMDPEQLARMMADRVNVCWGLKEGNSGVTGQGLGRDVAQADAGDLRNPADPEGWHPLHEAEGAGFRRARRIDVTRDPAAGLIRIDAAFQDSVPLKAGGRGAIHEYDIVVTADAATLEILTLDPLPRVLPFSECPGAVHNARRLIGARLPEMRDAVLGQLRGPEGCTHLNDALRALAEVPKLTEYLATATA